MFGDIPSSFPQKISFLLVPGFSLFGLTSMLDPLRHANRSSGEELYQWQLVSESGGLIYSSDSIEIMTHVNIAEADKYETLIVCAGTNPHHYTTSNLLSFIRQHAYSGADIGSQDTAAYITAAAGVLDGYRATVHWENLQSTAEAYPSVQFVQELLVIDRKRFSCPGALSGLDMMLFLIEKQHGHALSTEVADELVHTKKREHTDPQRASMQKRLGTRNSNLIDAVQLMEGNIEEPFSIHELSRFLGISELEIGRIFKRYLNVTPSAYYRNIRLEYARNMLSQTTSSVTQVATSCGFSSVSHFTQCYTKRFGKKPSQER